MNYYKRHLGDYARDTGHLTALEHGVYTLLLDWYYVNEKPIPQDKAERIARGNPKETQTVLEEFFKLTEKGWVHTYAERVIEEYHIKADRNRKSGKLGGRPSKTQTVSEVNPEQTLATSHKPLATKKEKPAPSGAISLQTFLEECTAIGELAIPEDDPVYGYAESIGLPDEYVALAWGWFKVARAAKRQKGIRGWRQHFRDAVRGNWPKYWYPVDGGGWALTTAGIQAERAQA